MAWKPDPEQADNLLRHIARGKTLADWLRSTPGAPSRDTVERWLKSDPESAVAMQQARDAGHDEIAEDALRIADEQPPTTEHGATDAGYVSWQKNRVWTRLQLLAKWNPKRYGDKVAVGGDPDAPPVKYEAVIRFVEPGQ
jgi:hypothetical protein